MALNAQVPNTETDMLCYSKHQDSMSLVSKTVTFTDITIQLREGKGENKQKRDAGKNCIV